MTFSPRPPQSSGEQIAVVDGERELSYAELEARSSRLAAAMIDCGVQPGDRVGLLLEKSLEAVIAIYGTLKAGAAYVPLDDQAPVRRLAYIARDADIRCLVSSEAKAMSVGAARRGRRAADGHRCRRRPAGGARPGVACRGAW